MSKKLLLILTALFLTETAHAAWFKSSKSKKKPSTDFAVPVSINSSKPCCKELKALRQEHQELEKESFYESLTLLTLLTKKDIKERLPQIPLNVLKKVIGEMQSTYVWMERASKHPKVSPELKDLLENTLIPRSKYLVNAIKEIIHEYNIGKRGSRTPLGHAGSARKKKS